MSKRQTCCLRVLFGACGKKRSETNPPTNRSSKIFAIEKSTQTQVKKIQNSSSEQIFTTLIKSTIMVRDSSGFRLQKSKEHIIIKNEEHIGSIMASDADIESIHCEGENDLVSSKSIIQFFPQYGQSVSKFQNPFQIDNGNKIKIKPVTPARRITLPSVKPAKREKVPANN